MGDGPVVWPEDHAGERRSAVTVALWRGGKRVRREQARKKNSQDENASLHDATSLTTFGNRKE